MTITAAIFTTEHDLHSAAADTDYQSGFTTGTQLFHADAAAGRITATTACDTVTAHTQPADFTAAGVAAAVTYAATLDRPLAARHYADGLINGYRVAARVEL